MAKNTVTVDGKQVGIGTTVYWPAYGGLLGYAPSSVIKGNILDVSENGEVKLKASTPKDAYAAWSKPDGLSLTEKKLLCDTCGQVKVKPRSKPTST